MEMIEQKLTELAGLASEQKTVVGKIAEDVKNYGAATVENKEALEKIREEMAKIHTQVDAIDASTQERIGQAKAEEKSIGDMFLESARYKEALEVDFREKTRVRVPFNRSAFSLEDRKAVIANYALGAGTAGIAMPQALISTPLEKEQIALRIRNIMRIQKLTTGNIYSWLVQTGRTNAASPQQESSPKAESTYTWEARSDDVTTLAHFTKVTKQALSDIPWLRRTIDSELLYGLMLKEEQEILAGSGGGEHLNGLITQATAYDTAYNVSGDTPLDKIRHAMLQARLAGQATHSPSGIVLHPEDMHDIELIKDQASNIGNYVVGDPKIGTVVKTVWGLPVVESDSITSGTFLVGAFATAATLIDRLEATVDISFENEDDFIKNKATIRCEERIGLAVLRPQAFITGTF